MKARNPPPSSERPVPSMLKTQRISHATLETPDLERQIDYQVNVLGLSIADRTPERVVMKTAAGQTAVILKRGLSARCSGVAFQVSPATSLDDAQRDLASLGIRTERRSCDLPGIDDVLSFEDPKGTSVDVFPRATFLASDRAPRNFTPLKLGHIAFKVRDVPEMVRFYEQALGFRVSDWRGDFFVWMRCGPDHHTANFVRGEVTKMHHIAFELADRAEILRACDFLGREGYRVIWGPGRHVIGDNVFTYHRDPDNNIVELYTELARMDSEDNGYFVPRPWRHDIPYEPASWGDDTLTNLWGAGPPPGFGD